MKQNKLKKQMLMLAATVCTGLSVQASDQMGPDGGAAPGADVPVIAAAAGEVAAAPQIALGLDYQSATVEQIKTEMSAGLNADIQEGRRFDLKDTSYSARIARKLLAMNRTEMIATVAEILYGNDELLKISGQLFRWLNGDDAPGNNTGLEIWNRMGSFLTPVFRRRCPAYHKWRSSVAWHRSEIRRKNSIDISISNFDNYILALIGRGITRVNLSSQRLTCMPQYINQLTKLQQLAFKQNFITQIAPGTFTGLTALQYLNLEDNRITTIAAGAFTGLTALQELYFEQNQITQIAAGAFTGLTALQYLHLGHNQITGIPADLFTGLTALEQLHLGNNRITGIPADLFTGLTALQELRLERNRIGQIAAGAFTGLTALQELFLNGNWIETIAPGTFTGLNALQKLYLSGNSCKVFPLSIIKLPRLRRLNTYSLFSFPRSRIRTNWRVWAAPIYQAFQDPTVAMATKRVVANALVFSDNREIVSVGLGLQSWLPDPAHVDVEAFMGTINLERLKDHNPTPLAPLTTQGGLTYTSRAITEYLRTQLLGADGNGGFLARDTASLIGDEVQFMNRDRINNVLHKLTVILNYNDADQVPIPDGFVYTFATDTPLQRTQIAGLRAILHHVYRALRTGGLDQRIIDSAFSELIRQTVNCPSGQMDGIETFARMLGINVEASFFKPDIEGHEADRFWGPLCEFKAQMAEFAIFATIAGDDGDGDGGIDTHQYSRLRTLFNNVIGLPILMDGYAETMTSVEEGEANRLWQHFAVQFNLGTICTYMMGVFNASPDTRASLRSIPELAQRFYGNPDFSGYAFGEAQPSDEAIYGGTTPITRKEMMLYIKIFIANALADQAEVEMVDSGQQQMDRILTERILEAPIGHAAPAAPVAPAPTPAAPVVPVVGADESTPETQRHLAARASIEARAARRAEAAPVPAAPAAPAPPVAPAVDPVLAAARAAQAARYAEARGKTPKTK